MPLLLFVIKYKNKKIFFKKLLKILLTKIKKVLNLIKRTKFKKIIF